jgi:hypothetical protein
MTLSSLRAIGSVAVAAGLITSAFGLAAPANADTTVNDFLGALGDVGITDIAPVDAVALGESVCPLLAQRGQNTADIASTVADRIGRPLGPATMFTGIAIASFCPGAVGSLGHLGF